MLEVKNLIKTYKNKKGINVKALNDISVTFPEKGMIFLLGKSGSGKSTLLNVCGGLDTPTSGEIIVKGKSSKNFSQSDFDSYRNTYIGFVFQEYNILNEFTVEENIGLALELQGKSKDKEAINELLKQVDLEGYAKRKPNTLSGGQKQRIAIARALIKQPEIIMADEPTGALDSLTGKQVLETLKKLSQDKLVIVVSHDREFAENYADRIIELKDGQIISDVSKTKEKQIQLTQNLSIIGDILHIKNGSNINESELLEIKKFLTNSENDIILAKGEKNINAFKTISKINTSGEKEVFKETQYEPSKEYQKEDCKFIRSKLPQRHAFKIGASSLKNKPLRLFFTIVLCTISFVLFGVLSTLTFYDSDSTFKETLKNSNLEYVPINKYYQTLEKNYYEGESFEYESSWQTSFSEEEYQNYKNEYGKDTFYGVMIDTSFNVQNPSTYWINRIETIAYISQENSLRNKINGKYPEKDNEILITSYTANVIYNSGIFNTKTSKPLKLSKPEDIIGKSIMLNADEYKVVGILSSGEINQKFEELKTSGEKNYILLNEFQSALSDGLHLKAFVTKEKLKTISSENFYNYGNDAFTEHNISVVIKTNGKYNFDSYSNATYASVNEKPKNDEVISLKDNKTTPSNKEVIISSDLFYELMMNYYNDKINNGDMNVYKEQELAFNLYQKGIYKQDKETNNMELVKFTEEEMKTKLNSLIKAFKKENKTLKVAVKLFNSSNQTYIGEEEELTVIGIWYLPSSYQNQRILLSDSYANKLWENQKKHLNSYIEVSTKYEIKNTPYQEIYLPYNHEDNQTEKLLNIYKDKLYKDDDSKTYLGGYTISNLEMIDDTVESLSKVFLYVGIVLAIFSALLFSNFISVSISYKKKEIGILRAVGARSADVFKIFFSESFLITVICLILSIIANVVITDILNKTLSSKIGASIFVFGIISLLVLITLALLTAVIATFLPVYNAAKKKPVESIRAI